MDLARYLEARFAGMTPGQQLGELAMVTAKEVRDAGSVRGAMADRARELAIALGCDRLEAMAILVKGLTELMPYVHQKRPIAIDATVQQVPTMFVVSEADMAAQLAPPMADDESAEILEGFLAGEDQVGPPKSDETP